MEIEFNIQHHYNSLEFYVTCETQLGEDVRICGNTIETGNWNPIDGHKLCTDAANYPVWKSFVPLILKNNSKLTYKACIINAKKCTWESNIPDREIQAQSPTIIKFNFDQPDVKTTPKKITEIECREGTFDIIQELQSSQGSSIEFRTNYPFESYFQHEDQENVQKDRKLSSQLSSNLFSINGQSQNQDIEDSINRSDPQIKIDEVSLSRTRSPELLRHRSIKPQILNFGRQQGDISIHLDLSGVRKRNHSKSRSNKRSESSSKSKKEEPQSPYMIPVPKEKKSKANVQPRTRVTNSGKKESKNDSSSTEERSEQRSDKMQNQGHQTDSSTSTVIEYDTETDYLNNRELDVVIEDHVKEYTQV